MGYFDWIFKYKFDNEKQTLIDLRTHTIDWYNQITEPLKPLIMEIQFEEDELKAEEYAQIARDIFKVKILSGPGGMLNNTMESMTEKGIPLFTSRTKLRRSIEEFQDSGVFLKELGVKLHRWKEMRFEERQNFKKKLFDNWQKFENGKDAVVCEINIQIKNLG